jgi:hypothetical protein
MGRPLRDEISYLDEIEDLETRIRSLKRAWNLSVGLMGFLILVIVLGQMFWNTIIWLGYAAVTASIILMIVGTLFVIGCGIVTFEYFDTQREFRNPWNRLRVVRRDYARFINKQAGL